MKKKLILEVNKIHVRGSHPQNDVLAQALGFVNTTNQRDVDLYLWEKGFVALQVIGHS